MLQGLGGSPIPPMTMMFMSNVFPSRSGHGHGVVWHGADRWSHCGYRHWGLYHEYLGWRMVFFLNFVPGVICIVLVLLVLPNVRERYSTRST